ncbi:hypothetical protein AMATHDRAFT_70284 [Amanita thiersii Skay4041]|uniref:Fungal-type protein kinase domain-containing protein n=1 Tax=Amanita thiersii Skay4041 TaxID=703135 RepID=A0A2A9N8Q9_9AGAR|nr:hypothetical protein AMATHDRAFT_70284 [Amanita thiersii Skay4041]
MFSSRPTRRYILSLMVRGLSARLSLFCRSYVTHGDFFDIEKKPVGFLRILIGFMFCESKDIGFDTTITSKYEAEGLVRFIMAGGLTYRVIEPLFIRDMIRGRRMYVWKVMPRSNPDLNDASKWDTIKDAWVDTAQPPTEDFFINHARENGITEGIPEIISAKSALFDGKEDTTHNFLDDKFWTNCRLEGKEGKLAKDMLENRLHKRLIFRGCGIPITNFRNKKELLQILADSVQVNKKLREKELLHRDISIKNLMMTCDGPRYQGLLIDFDYMAIMSELLKDTKAVAHRPGTVPFMSINVLGGAINKPADDLQSFFYVLVFICLGFSGPGRERNWDYRRKIHWDIYQTRLSRWLLGEDLTRLSDAKAGRMISESKFQRDVLIEFPRYSRDLSACLRSLWGAIFRSDEVITHDVFIRILDQYQAQEFDENIPDDSPFIWS